MRNFVTFTHGENFILEVDGKVQLAGFFATRRVEAKSEAEATEMALNLLRSEPELSKSESSEAGLVSNLTVMVVHEMPMEHKNTYSGYTLYAMEEK